MFLKIYIFHFLNYFIQNLFHLLSTEHLPVQVKVLREGEMWVESGRTSWKRRHLLKFDPVEMGRSRLLRAQTSSPVKTPGMRNLGSPQKKEGKGHRSGFRGKRAVSPLYTCYF